MTKIEIEANNGPRCAFRKAKTLDELREIAARYGEVPPPLELQTRGRYLHIRITESEVGDE